MIVRDKDLYNSQDVTRYSSFEKEEKRN